ncbi:hypothetical protein J3E68DRAFT_411906 [Trichoderma sp. SZMC 28012]
MVNSGKSKGCNTCKKRKVKCDEVGRQTRRETEIRDVRYSLAMTPSPTCTLVSLCRAR